MSVSLTPMRCRYPCSSGMCAVLPKRRKKVGSVFCHRLYRREAFQSASSPRLFHCSLSQRVENRTAYPIQAKGPFRGEMRLNNLESTIRRNCRVGMGRCRSLLCSGGARRQRREQKENAQNEWTRCHADLAPFQLSRIVPNSRQPN